MRANRKVATVLAALTACAAFGGEAWSADRVVGGTEAKAGAWPFMAYLLIGGAWQCGGTLVAKNMVLTAAHCTLDADSGKPWPDEAYTVRLGSNDSDRGGIVRRVARTIVHEKYDPQTSENDIALLVLREAVDLPTVALAAPQSMTRGLTRYEQASAGSPFGEVVGWGRTDAEKQYSISHNLMEAPIPIVEASACNDVMGGTDHGPIDERRICAGLSQGGVDACNGDSGGPLLAPGQNDRWVEVGVTSWGVTRCGDPKTYGVYTRVSAYNDWLVRKMNADEASPVAPPSAPTPAAAPHAPTSAATAGEGGLLAVAPTIMAAAAREDGRVKVALCHGLACDAEGLRGRPLKVGETFTLQIQSSFNGYLLLLDVGSDGKVTQLFPNPYSAKANADGRILAGSPLTLPDKSYGFTFSASEPLGRGRVIAVVAKDKASFAEAFNAKNGFADLSRRGRDHLNRLEAVLKPLTVAPPVTKPVIAAETPKPITVAETSKPVTKPVVAAETPKPITVAETPKPVTKPVAAAPAAKPVVKPSAEKPKVPVEQPAAVGSLPKPEAVPVIGLPVGWAAGQRDYIVGP